MRLVQVEYTHWVCGGLWWVEKGGLGFVLSHPFPQMTRKWMGHGTDDSPHEFVSSGFVLSHPFAPNAGEWMGHGTFVLQAANGGFGMREFCIESGWRGILN